MQHVRAKKPNRRLRPWILGSAAGIALIVGGGIAAQAATGDQSGPAKPVPVATSKPEPTKPAPTEPPTSVPEPTKPAPTEPPTSAPEPTKPAPTEPPTSAPEPTKPAPTKAGR